MKNIFTISAALLAPCLLAACMEIMNPGSYSAYGKPADPMAGTTGERMQTFVEDISRYAREQKPGFIIIPQNGEELAFTKAKVKNGIHAPYFEAVDGVGVEELFYDGGAIHDTERLAMLRTLGETKKIMVSDYVSSTNGINAAIKLSLTEGFIPFPRDDDNYDYLFIPDQVTNSNNRDVRTLADAQNYLYLISDDEFDTKNDFLSAIAATSYDMVIIDLFFKGEALTSADISRLKTKPAGGSRLIIAYISVGSAETYRYYFEDDWVKGDPAWLQKNYSGYEKEFWVQFWHPDWRAIIFGNETSYFRRIINAGFDGAYLDNVEAYRHVSD